MILLNLFTFLGLALAAVLLVQLFLVAYGTAQRLSLARAQGRMEGNLFAERLTAARLQLRQQEGGAPWNGTRKFTVDRVVPECEGVCSFYLVPHDKKPLPFFHPGQYLTFELLIPGERNRVIRCYSLSDRPRPDYYRVTIKRIPAPPDKPGGRPGLVSNFFQDRKSVV